MSTKTIEAAYEARDELRSAYMALTRAYTHAESTGDKVLMEEVKSLMDNTNKIRWKISDKLSHTNG